MALLHVKLLSLRNKGIRTFSATLMVVLFFGWAFLLLLKPPHPPQAQSPLPLSVDLKNVSVRALSTSALDAVEGEDRNNVSDGMDLQGKNGRENNGRIHSERIHSERIHNNENEHEKSNDRSSDHNDDKDAADKAASKGKTTREDQDREGRFEPDSRPNNNPQDTGNTDAGKQDNKTPNESEERNKKSEENIPAHPPTFPQSPNPPQPAPLNTNTPDRRPQDRTSTTRVTPKPRHFQLLGSNLDILPFQSFVSPFIDSAKEDGNLEKKVITWHQPKGRGHPNERKLLRDMKRKKRLLKNCPEANCRLVYPLPRGVDADAIVFDDVDTSMAPPTRRHANQVYVLHKTRPPSSPQLPVWPAVWRWAFNWTWSYRRDSTIWQPSGLLTDADTVPPVDYFITLAEGKSRALAWIPRTCPILGKTSSKRNEFVEELREHVPVSEFGSCSNQMCARENVTCSELLSQNYFFMLALEDDLCKDYVTEVFYRAWQEGAYVLPVVRGGADYASYFPLGTYINADWFDSVQQLYSFLAELIADRKLYAQLLWRKSHWVRAQRMTEELALCHLCYKLHHMRNTPRSYLDAYRWSERSGCRHQS